MEHADTEWPEPKFTTRLDHTDATEIIRRARRWIADYDRRHREHRIAATISASTVRAYTKTRARLARTCANEDSLPGIIAQRSGAMLTYTGYRAAWYWFARQEIPVMIAALEVCVQSGAIGPEFEASRLELERCLTGLESFGDRSGLKRRVMHRRLRIAQMPDGWRETLAAALPEQHRMAFLVASLTGCRPCELSRGVTVEQLHGPSDEVRAVSFEIHGAKLTEHRGQPLRRLEIAIGTTPLAGLLVLQMNRIGGVESGSAVQVVSVNKSTLQAIIARTARRLWPLGPAVSVYSMRYQFADEQRRQGTDAKLLARAMGHTCELSQIAYSRTRRGKVRAEQELVAPLLATASRPVRERHRDGFELARRRGERER